MGYRAAMAALSDLAAMGAEPVVVLASLAGTATDARSGFLAEVGRGIRSAARTVGIDLAGGDVTRSPGPVLVDVVAVGDTDAPVLRSGARPGDEVWVTGSLGGAAAAVDCWLRGEEPPPELRALFAQPTPRFSVMAALRESGQLTAGMDLSDGLLGDAGHIAAASGVAVRIWADRVPLHPSVEGAWDPRGALRLGVSGGDDYELLITARPGLDAWSQELEGRTGVQFTRVGQVEVGSGVQLDGADLRSVSGGWDHFRPRPSPPDGEP